jgi:hypothetical protein
VAGTADWTLLKMNPDKQWGGQDVTWQGEHKFDAAVFFDDSVDIKGTLTCGSHFTTDDTAGVTSFVGDVSISGRADVTTPATDPAIANKKYVDDQITAAQSSYGLRYSGAQVYNANAPNSWTDLDLSAVVGSNRALVYLKVVNTGTANGFTFRTNGGTEDIGNNNDMLAAAACTGARIGQNDAAFILVITDTNGIIEHRCGGTPNIDIWVLTYQVTT